MDYQCFLVRPPGNAAIGSRAHRGAARLFRILDHGISVLPLATPNAAPAEYRFEHITKVTAADDDPAELVLEILDTSKSGFGYEMVRFCCDSRTALLTAILNRLDDMNGIGTDYFLKKHSNQRGGLADTVLRVRNASIVKMVNIGHRTDREVRAAKKVNFQDIVKLEMLSDDEQIVLVSLKSRTLRLSIKDSLPFLCAIQRNMKANLKRDIEIRKLETSVMVDNVTAHYKKVRESPVLYEFQAVKRSNGLNQERQRTLCITQHLLIERSLNDIMDVLSLEDLLGLVVSETNDQEVILEFRSWRDSQYFVKDRDDFVASVADVMGIGKGCTFSIRLEPFHSYTFPDKPNPFYQNECEMYYINRFMAAYHSTREAWALHMPLKEYAANIQVGDSQCNDARVLQAVADTLKECVGNSKPDSVRATTCCMVLLRLLASKPCFDSIRGLPEIASVLFQCLRSTNNIISYHATVVIRAAIKLAAEPGSTDVGVASKQEFANRLSVLSADYLQQLVALLHTHALARRNSLQVTGLLDILTLALSSPPTENDAGRLWLRAYEASIMAAADLLCTFFRSTSDVVFTRLSILLQALLTKMSPIVCKHLQRVCLGRCVLLLHLSTAIFSKKPQLQLLSCNQLFLMMEGNREAKKLLEALLPKGVLNLYANKLAELPPADKESTLGRYPAWKDTIELLQNRSFETPLLVWNDIKRSELKKFLRDEMEGYYAASETNPDIFYNTADVKLVYSAASEGGGSVIRGIHLELLVDHLPPAHGLYNSFWKLGDPLPIFQSVFQAMLLGFTPLFGHNNLPELDLRLAVHVLTWIYERHSDDVTFCMETLKVIETVVGMLREVIDSEHEVFVFKLVMFLLAAVDNGRRENVVRFVRAGGAAVLAPLVVLSVDKCCKEKSEFECDAWTGKDATAWGAFEMAAVVGSDGVSRLVRIPSGRAREVLGKSVQDGSLEAKEGIRWQDNKVPPKIQLGLALDLLEAILRVSRNNDNKEHYPPSAAALGLSKEETLCHLVQSLLRLKSPVFSRVLEIVSSLAKANKSAMARLYSLGAFEILLWKLLAGDLVDWEKDMICKLLLQCHLHQDRDSMLGSTKSDKQEELVHWRNSALRLYLPDGLILKLVSEGSDSVTAFASALDTEQNAPDIIWNMKMRQRLLDHLTSELEPYVKSRSTDPLALYVHTPRAPVYYPELAESVFCAPFYLENLLDRERFPDFPIKDPVGFLNSLMVDLRKLANTTRDSVWCKETPRTHLLLEAQAHVVDRFPKLTLPSDAESLVTTLASPSLQTCLAEKEHPPQASIDILQHACTVLRRFCAANTRDDDVPQASQDFALDVLSLGTRWDADGSGGGSLELAISGSLSVLEVLSSARVGRRDLWDDARWQKGLWWALCSTVNDADATPPRGPSATSFAAMSCLKHFASDSEYRQRIIAMGFYLPLLLAAVPPPTASTKPRSADSALRAVAADVLGSFLRGGEGAGLGRLATLIPMSLLSRLEKNEGVDGFVAVAGSEIKRPTFVWTADVRAELHRRLHERISRRGEELAATVEVEEKDEARWLESFKYACLQNEFVVGGIFVKHLATGRWDGDEFPNNASFLESMMEYLEIGRAAVVSVKEVDADELESEPEPEDVDDKYIISEGQQERPVRHPIDLENYITVLTALREYLKFTVSHGRADLLTSFRLPIVAEMASAELCAPRVWVEVMSILGVLAEDATTRNGILQSNLLGVAGVRLWDVVTQFEEDDGDAVLVATLEMLRALSGNLTATIEDTNYFASSGVLFPLLCLFCGVDLPSLRTGIMETGWKISAQQRRLVAQILGQLLLSASGVNDRSEHLDDAAQLRASSAGMYDVMSLLEPGISDPLRADPAVIRTLTLLLPLNLLTTLARDPSRACKIYDDTTHSPRLVWDEETRYCVKQTLTKEAVKLQGYVKHQVLAGLGPWSLELRQPVFTRWVLAVVAGNGGGESKPLYRCFKEDGYVPEMYLGGFFLDQFLRKPEYDFGDALERRFLREVRTAVILSAPRADEADHLRRLVLALLLLFKGRPYLLSGRSNIDIFLAINPLVCTTGKDGRALAQPAMLLTHFIANHKDMVDCIVSEEFVFALVSFLNLRVPPMAAGFAGTDPKLCSLMLLLRLIRLSQSTVEITSRPGIVAKLAGVVLDVANHDEVSKTALECLAIMCHDKRKGQDVIRQLDNSVPVGSRGFWDIPVNNIFDDVVDFESLKHFLQHRHPCAWWSLDAPEGMNGDDEKSMNSVDAASVTRPNSKAAATGSDDEEDDVLTRAVSIPVQISHKRSG